MIPRKGLGSNIGHRLINKRKK